MKANRLNIIPFYISVAIFLAAMFANIHLLELIFKPLMILSLMYFFIKSVNIRTSSFFKYTLLALSFSLIGDVFLMFNKDDGLLFILGIAAFLIGHVFYILAFSRILIENKVKFNWFLIVLVGLLFSATIPLLVLRAGEFAIPVFMYSLTICTMLAFALQLLKVKGVGVIISIGAALFVISDSLIAILKFITPISHGGWWVMLTYIAAQYLIIIGLERYFSIYQK